MSIEKNLDYFLFALLLKPKYICRKVEYINARGTLLDANTVSAKLKNGTERQLKTNHVILAMGGRPIYPDVPGALENCITSDDIFSLPEAPGKTLIIGAGYIGLECAGFLNEFGMDATVMVRSVVLRGFDQQMAGLMAEEMSSRGVKFLHKCVPVSMDKQADGKVKVTWKSLQVNLLIVFVILSSCSSAFFLSFNN